MFATLTQKILLGVYIFVLLSIPVGAYLVSETQTTKSRASEQTNKPVVPVTPKPSAQAPSRTLLDLSQKAASSSAKASPSPSPAPSSPTIATTYGPTLSLKAVLEGRPKDNQKAKAFVGIIEGTVSANPKFLLSFTIDLPADGVYSGLSLAGLNSGSTYSALIKGPAQIAKALSFTMSPNMSNLNGGEAITLLSGDLNDDNVINSADYSIVQKIIGAKADTANWNENADLNKDNVINIFDLGIIAKNMGKFGDSGAWTSPIPKTATPSGNLNPPPAGSPQNGGYWIWIPK